MVGAMNILTTDTTTGNGWLTQQQVQEHNAYANWQTTQCWGIVPSSMMQIVRGDEYISWPRSRWQLHVCLCAVGPAANTRQRG